MKKVRWGVIGTAKIASDWLIPAIHESEHAEIVAVASRDLGRAKQYASENNIPQAYGSYEALLASDEIDAVYNPMPNHQHVPWSIKAIEAGKHVLCEKPIGLDVADTRKLIQAAEQNPNVVVMEAFMYRFHPQWQKVKQLIESGELGNIRQVHACFTYFNRDPKNVRNMPGIGGGGLLDIGCYCISAARLAFGKEPSKVNGTLELDPDFQVDVHCAAIMDFGDGMATFNCSTQANSSQLVHIVGDKARLVVDTPFYRRDDHPCELALYRDQKKEIIPIGHYNHYVFQVDAFSKAVLLGETAPTPLSDALNNMAVIDAVFKSAKSSKWENVDSAD